MKCLANGEANRLHAAGTAQHSMRVCLECVPAC